MSLELFWGGAPVLEETGRDEAIANGAQLEELGLDGMDGSSASDKDEGDGDYDGDNGEPRKSARYKQPRVAGGIAAIAKPIREDYDSDDGRIVALKLEGLSDVVVANKLKEEGRMRYEPKTVGSRWSRIRKLLEEKENERLDDELSDWHEGEDEKLNVVCEAVEHRYEKLRNNLEEKKWEEVSQHVAEKLGRKKYTAKACKDRWQGLKDGTADVPIELDEDQVGRRHKREARIAAAKQARADIKAEQRAQAEAKKERANAKKREQAEANQRRTAEALRKQKEREERDRIKKEREVNRARMRQRRLAILNSMRAHREWETTRNRAEKKLYRKLTGYDIDGLPVRTRRKTANYDSEDEEQIDEFESDEEEAEAEMSDLGSESEDDESNAGQRPSTGTRRSTRLSASKDGFKKPATPAKAIRIPVTEDTLVNPRAIMTDNELDMLLHRRGLPRRDRAGGETHAEVVARLAAGDEELKTDELDDMLDHACVKKKGKKIDKVRMLQEADARRSEQGQAGVSATDLEFINSYSGYEGQFEYLRKAAEDEYSGKQDSIVASTIL